MPLNRGPGARVRSLNQRQAGTALGYLLVQCKQCGLGHTVISRGLIVVLANLWI